MIRLTSGSRVVLAFGVFCLAAECQQPTAILAAILELKKDLAQPEAANASDGVPRPESGRYTELLTRLRAEAPTKGGAELARAYIELWYCAEALFPATGQSARLLDELDALLQARPGPPHGRSQLLNRRTRIEMDARVERTQLEAWNQLVADFAGPKRFWIGCEAARSFVTNCGCPQRAEQLLTALLHEIESVPEWSEAERRALVHDPDLWIVEPERPTAASRRDTLGQLLTLRAYAREQIGSLMPAIEDLQAAQEHLAATKNEHRSLNCEQTLASIWLQLGCFDVAIATAERVRVRYQQRSDGNGERAMRKVKAQAQAGGGNWSAAAAEMERLVVEKGVEGETNIDALTSYMEALLHLPPTSDLRACFDQQLLRIRAECGTDRSRLILWRAELLLAERRVQDGDFVGARSILAAAAGPLALHRHVPLQVRRLVLCGDCARPSDPLAALGEYEKAAALLEQTVTSDRMWRLDGVTVQFAQQFHAIMSGAHEAVRTLVGAGSDSVSAIGRLYVLTQKFHGFESLCRMLDGGSFLPSSPQERQEVEQMLQAIRDAEGAYETLRSAAPQTARSRQGRPAALAVAERRIAACEQRLNLALAPFGLPSRGLAHSSPIEVQQRLAAGELLVECVELPGGAFAFALTRTECELHSLPSGLVWQDVVRDLRAQNLRDEQWDEDIPELKQCSAQLLADNGWFAKRLARGDITRLLWSPEGTFGFVPIDALPYQHRPLVERLIITHVISGGWLLRQRERDPRPPLHLRLLALANPRYRAVAVQELVQRSLVGGGAFAPLPATALETLQVARLFADLGDTAALDAVAKAGPEAFDGELTGRRFRALLGACAKETALESAQVADYQVLHFACHGEGRSDAPAMSFLALSPEGEAGHPDAPGLLRLAELSRLRGDFELVTLSACQTSAGNGQGHDAVGGLAWAAQLAGARRVLATLWSVPDASTRDLVVAFYRRWLVEGLACSEALAETKRWAITQGLPVRAWAAFVLWGDSR